MKDSLRIAFYPDDTLVASDARQKILHGEKPNCSTEDGSVIFKIVYANEECDPVGLEGFRVYIDSFAESEETGVMIVKGKVSETCPAKMFRDLEFVAKSTGKFDNCGRAYADLRFLGKLRKVSELRAL